MKLIDISRISVLSLHYNNYTLDYFLDCQAKLGIKNVELLSAHQGLWMDEYGYQDPAPIRRKLEERGLCCPVFTPENCAYGYQFAAKEPEHIERSFGYFSNGIRLANELGCEYMEVNSGWGYWNEDKQEAWKRSAAMLHRLAEVAKENGITLVMESIRPEESQLVINLEAAQKMLKEVNHPNLKGMVDTCAMGVAGETLEDWFQALGSDIRHMHFIDGTPYGHLVWGDGSHHLGRFIEVLNRYGYEGYLGQEITDGRYYMDPAAADLRNMKNFERYIED